MEPLVSVILPSYNRFDSLLNSIKSINEQTHKNIEMIKGGGRSIICGTFDGIWFHYLLLLLFV